MDAIDLLAPVYAARPELPADDAAAARIVAGAAHRFELRSALLPDGSTRASANRTIAGIAGLNPRNLFDAERAKVVYPLAREQGRRWGERRMLRAELVA